MAELTDDEKAAAAAAEAAAAGSKAGVKRRKVRVLLAIHDHKPNDVISLPEDEAAAAVAGGWADDSKAAVAYAESLAKAEAKAES